MLIDELPDYPALRQVQHALWGAAEVRGAAVMVGAGFSKFANLASLDGRSPPLWNDFDVEIRKRLHGENLPSDPLKLAEQYGAALGRHALDALIRELVCDHQWTPGEMHSRLLGLPWADVLTTNWDTLLERTQLEEPDRTYEVVRVISDIARTRSPRIVKLHGSLPSHEPFIFTAEDFRTYPRQFAPFVNLAQQVLLENELCLIGFSGDDPNFLQWSGWVRDQLGSSARKIRLIGVLNLSPSRRQVFEQHNISPIDLAPLVADCEDDTKHRRAMTLFIDSLWTAKPKPNHEWTRHKRDRNQVTISTEQEAEVFLQTLAKQWKEDRECYPGWLVAPHPERTMLFHDTTSYFSEFGHALAKAGPQTRALIAYEMIWRREIAFVPLTADVIKLAKEALEDDSRLGSVQRDEMRIALMRAARRRRDWSEFESLADTLTQSSSVATKDSINYERALCCRDNLDFVGVAAAIDGVDGDDPAWAIRRAALQCELGEDKAASETLLQTWNEIRRRRARDRASIWLLSREAWAAWLMQRVHFTLRLKLRRQSQDAGAYDRWPVKYKAANCDPWDEMTFFDHDFSERFSRRLREAEIIQPRFDAGTYKDQSKTIYFRSDISPTYGLFALADQVGLSSSIGNFDVLGSRFAQSLELTEKITEAEVWAATLRLPSGTDGFIDRYFSRTRIARMPLPTVLALAERLKHVIDFGRARLPAIDWVSRNVKYTELLSRLVVRFSSEEAKQMFRWAVEISNDARWNHWWQFEPLENLLVRCLASVSPAERKELALLAMQLKLPKDIGSQGMYDRWPELAFVFKPIDYRSRDSSYAWSQTIATLIETVRRHGDIDRTRAIWRLVAMHDSGILTEDEKKSFGEALWDQRQGPDGFPDHASLYEQVFLHLPQPKPGVARAAFERNVIKKLAQGELEEQKLMALAASARPGRGRTVETALGVADARAILKACLAWKPKVRDHSDIFERDTQQDAADSIGPCLSNAVLPALSVNDLEPDDVRNWSDSLRGGPVASMVQTAAQFARLLPEREDEAISSIRRGLASRTIITTYSAILAINQLVRLRTTPPDTFPLVLSSDVVTMCVTRRDAGLLMSLSCARGLIREKLLFADDEKRLAEALELLLVETDYQTWDERDQRTPSLSLIRRECVRLARALKQREIAGRGIDDWLSAHSDDPMPEVRFALMDNEDD